MTARDPHVRRQHQRVLRAGIREAQDRLRAAQAAVDRARTDIVRLRRELREIAPIGRPAEVDSLTGRILAISGAPGTTVLTGLALVDRLTPAYPDLTRAQLWRQVRNALLELVGRGELCRVARGIYRSAGERPERP